MWALDSEEKVKKALLDERLSRSDQIEVLAWIMESPLGRRFVWTQLEASKIFHSSLGDHHVMAFREGMKQNGLWLYGLIQSDARCRRFYDMLRREMEERQKTEENEK